MNLFRGVLVAAVVVGLSTTAVEAKRIMRQTPEQKAPRPADAEIYRAGILIEADSGTVLFEKNPHLKAPPASMTKMMLILLVAERVRDGSLHWDDPITASAWASKIGGSQVYLKQGEVFPLSEMMQAIVIHSANDASVAVAEAVAGSSEAFVDLMNERAKQLGMNDTTYHSVHGLPPGKGQQPDISSAHDLATVARELVKFPDVMKWAGTKEAPFRNGAMTLTNTNRLVRETSWVDGLKTGYYREAGFNVTATGQRDGMRLIAVILGAPQKHDCFGEAGKLLNKGFADYKALGGRQAGRHRGQRRRREGRQPALRARRRRRQRQRAGQARREAQLLRRAGTLGRRACAAQGQRADRRGGGQGRRCGRRTRAGAGCGVRREADVALGADLLIADSDADCGLKISPTICARVRRDP